MCEFTSVGIAFWFQWSTLMAIKLNNRTADFFVWQGCVHKTTSGHLLSYGNFVIQLGLHIIGPFKYTTEEIKG